MDWPQTLWSEAVRGVFHDALDRCSSTRLVPNGGRQWLVSLLFEQHLQSSLYSSKCRLTSNSVARFSVSAGMRGEPFNHFLRVSIREEDRIKHLFDPACTSNHRETLDQLKAGKSEGWQP